MKKLKVLLTFLLSLCFLTPLSACQQDELLQQTPPQDSVGEESAANESPTPVEPNESETPVLPTEPTPPAEEIPSVNTPPVVQQPSNPTAQYIKCTGERVNLRAGAGTDFAVVGSAEQGTTYAVVGKVGSWYKTYYRGKVAYLSAAYASVFTLDKTENKVENVIEEGCKHIGVPYVYGATRVHDGNGKLLGGFNVQKFDCSSLVQYMFYKGTGTLLGVTTRTQVKQGTFVKRADLRRGDCIYFTNESRQYNVGIERIGHVAVYLGDGYILHTSSDYARIEKMSAKRWSFYVETRRFVE